MTLRYTVSIHGKKEVHSLPGIWSPADLRLLLEKLDMDNVANIDDSELCDYATMMLQETDDQVGGEQVLDVVFGSAMSSGVRQNLVDDLTDDQPWQDFSNVLQQRGIFTAVVMLQQAFPNRYGTPDATELRFSVASIASSVIPTGSEVTPQWLMRVLAAGMAESDILLRLFGENIETGQFPEAAGIVWHFSEQGPGEFTLISSKQWLEPLTTGSQFPVKLD